MLFPLLGVRSQLRIHFKLHVDDAEADGKTTFGLANHADSVEVSHIRADALSLGRWLQVCQADTSVSSALGFFDVENQSEVF